MAETVVATKQSNGVLAQVQAPTAPVTRDSVDGREVLMRSATLVLAEAVHSILGGQLVVRHATAVESTELFAGYYCTIDGGAQLDDTAKGRLVEAVAASVAAGAAIERRVVAHAHLAQRFTEQGSTRSLAWIAALNADSYDTHVINGYYALALDHVTTPTTSLCGCGGDLEMSWVGDGGLWLRFAFMPPILNVPGFHTAYNRGTSPGTATSIGALSKLAVSPEGPASWIAAEEERFDANIMNCAQAIHERGAGTKLVLIAGPSASGKTTFSHKLALAMRALGREPTVLSTDDYYQDKRNPTYPRLPNGEPNHEVVECMRLEDFGRDCNALFRGEAVMTPIFDMKNSRPRDVGRRLRLSSKGMLIMEGIFALDKKMTQALPQDAIFRIFIVPIPGQNVDDLTFQSNQATRTLRRIARDYRHRGRDASASIARLPTVREGETKAIFPNMVNADFVLNSALQHELPVLQVYCSALLKNVMPCDPTYCEARRLASLFTVGVSDSPLPPESLLREFVGGSVFDEDDTPVVRRPGPLTSPAACGASDSTTPLVDVPVNAAAEPQATVGDVLKTLQPGALSLTDGPTTPPVAALVDGVVTSLNERWAGRRARVAPVDRTCSAGRQVLFDTLGFVVLAASRTAQPTLQCVVRHDLAADGGLAMLVEFSSAAMTLAATPSAATEIAAAHADATCITDAAVESVMQRVKELLLSDAAITTSSWAHDDAIDALEASGMYLAHRLLQSCISPAVTLVTCAGIVGWTGAPLAASAGALLQGGQQQLHHVVIGRDVDRVNVVIRVGPSNSQVPVISPLELTVLDRVSAARAGVHRGHSIASIADINDAIARGEGGLHKRTAATIDSMHSTKIARQLRDAGRHLVVVSGTPCSGKTNFAKGLALRLRALGDVCVEVPAQSDDDPAQQDASETQLASLRQVVDGLLTDHDVSVDGKAPVRLPPGRGTVIVEGLTAAAMEKVLSWDLHSTPVLTVFVTTLTVLNIAETRFVSGTDVRCLRRMIRDSNARGVAAAESLNRCLDDFESCEATSAETAAIGKADIAVSATSVVELNVMAAQALCLLRTVKPAAGRAFVEAQRLIALLSVVQPDF